MHGSGMKRLNKKNNSYVIDAGCVKSLSNGTDCGAPAVAADSGQSLRTLQTEKGLRWICQMLLLTDCNYSAVSLALLLSLDRLIPQRNLYANDLVHQSHQSQADIHLR